MQDGRHYTARQITESVADASYDKRTIQRDIEFMRDSLNAPIASDNTGYYYTEPNFFIKSIPLTEGELFAVAVLNPLLEQYRNTPIEERLRSVFTKITQCLPDKITVDTSFLNPKLTFIPDKSESVNPQFFQTIFDSLRACRTLSFEYRPLQKSTYMERKLDPYHVVCQRGNWYVIGRCHDKGDVRIFSFARMRKLCMEKECFKVPKDFNPNDYFDSQMGVWLSDRKLITVEFVADREIGTYALNRVWNSTQVVQEKDDGSVYVKFTTTQKQEVLRWILGQGHTVRVLAPKEFVDEVKAEIEKMKKMYE